LHWSQIRAGSDQIKMPSTKFTPEIDQNILHRGLEKFLYLYKLVKLFWLAIANSSSPGISKYHESTSHALVTASSVRL
jgi:hypothetical protein